MKKYTSVFAAAAFLSVAAFVFAPAVHAEDQTEAQLKQMELQYEAQKKAAEGATEAQKREMEQKYETQKREVENVREAQKQEVEVAREAAKTAAESVDDTDENDSDSDSDSEEENEDEGERHRSAVAEFVHSLNTVASSTSRGIGEQVREVAREQNELKDKTAENLKSIESRTTFIRFLIGSNRESIKALEDSAVVMQSHIDTLAQVEENTSPEVKKILAAQVEILAKEKARIQSTIDAHKNDTGIFGWLIGMF